MHLNNHKRNNTITKLVAMITWKMNTIITMETTATVIAMRNKNLASSGSRCPSSPDQMTPKNISHGHSKSTRSSICTIIATRRWSPWLHFSLMSMPTFGGNKFKLLETQDKSRKTRAANHNFP